MLSSRQPSSPAADRERGTYEIERQSGGIRIVLGGIWDVRTVMAREVEIIRLLSEPEAPGTIDLSGVTLLDTVGAIAVLRMRDRFRGAEIVGARPAQIALMEQVSRADARLVRQPPAPTMLDRLAQLGAWAVNLWHDIRSLIGFFGELTVVFWRIIRNPKRLRYISVVKQMQVIGVDAMPIVSLLAFLVGIVLADLSADQLKRFGAANLVVNLLGISVLRELGVFLTAVMVAGRSGSAFAAEIGTMKINQEIDAMRTIGLDPVEVLVVPRILGLMIILVPLGFIASLVMITGGAILADMTLGIGLEQFLNNFRPAVPIRHLWVGLIKAPFFAYVIAMIGCYHGLQVTGSAESVGQHTTQSVVWSIFVVIMLDAIFAVLFTQIGW